MTTHRRLPAAVGALAGLLLAACAADGGATTAPSAAPVEGDTIQVADNAFDPGDLEVTAGDTVTWVWEGRSAHDVVGDDFDSGIQRDGTFSHGFEEPGTYDYQCTLHRGMTGQVTVLAP